jgi:hypothetical protein
MSDTKTQRGTAEGASEPCARRELVAAVLGGLGAAALLSGCDASGQPIGELEPLGDLQQGLAGNANVKFADTVAELRLLSGGLNSWIAVLSGYHTKGDGGGGLFYWSTTAALDNQGTIINLGAGFGPGWRRLFSGPTNVKWFGARGDATTNDAPAIQAAINYLETTGGELLFPPTLKSDGTAGHYLCTVTLDLDNTHGLALTGVSGLAASAPITKQPMLVYDGLGTLLRGRSVSHLRLSGIHFQASNENHMGDLLAFGRLSGEGDAGDITIERCGFQGQADTNSLINLNETICVTIRQSAFRTARVGIRGRDGSYSNAVTLDGANVFHSFSVSAIYNAGEAWLVNGAVFEGTHSDGTFSRAYDQDDSSARALTFQNCWCGDAPSNDDPRTWFRVKAIGLLFSNNYVGDGGDQSTALEVQAGSQGVVLIGGRLETPIGVNPVDGVVRGFSAIGVDGLTIANEGNISAGIAFGNFGTGNEMWLTSADGLVINDLRSTNPGAGSKQLWYDPADGNRVKFAP